MEGIKDLQTYLRGMVEGVVEKEGYYLALKDGWYLGGHITADAPNTVFWFGKKLQGTKINYKTINEGNLLCKYGKCVIENVDNEAMFIYQATISAKNFDDASPEEVLEVLKKEAKNAYLFVTT